MNRKSLLFAIALGVSGSTVAVATFMNGTADKRKAYVKGEPVPTMEARHPDLVPQPLPARVRYVFESNERVNAAAERLQTAVTSGDAKVFKDSLMLMPGANRLLGKVLGTEDSKMSVVDPADLKKGKIGGGLKMSMLNKPDQVTQAAAEVSRLLQADGGFTVRALATDEMAHWWVYIMFDIEEPVFVLASKGGKYRFVVELNAAGQVAILDELGSLPPAR